MPELSIPIESFQPPSLTHLRRRLALMRWYFAPRISGTENVDAGRPALFVGNHAIFGMIDSPLFVYELYRLTGVYPRSLGDFAHFNIPGWGRMLRGYGAVPGTPENCARLMEAGQFILVFPGGAREVAKRRSERNDITWKNRTGFARMAMSHGYDILPFASVGCDDAWDILFDGDDLRNSRLGRWLLGLEPVNRALRGGDTFMPLVRGLGPTALPRPEPFRFRIGAPIATAHLREQAGDRDAQWQVREQVSDAIRGMIADMQAERAAEPLPGWRRWLAR